jgi:hypothetical protein
VEAQGLPLYILGYPVQTPVAFANEAERMTAKATERYKQKRYMLKL